MTNNNTTQAKIIGSDVEVFSGTNKDIIDTTERNLLINAIDDTKTYNVTGSAVLSGGSGIGLSASINNISRDTFAGIVADVNTNNIVNKRSNIILHGAKSDIFASNIGEILDISVAGTVSGTDSPASNAVETASTTTSKPEDVASSKSAGSFGIGVSGDAALNTITDSAKTEISNSNFTNLNTELSMLSKNNTTISALSGSAALNLSNKSSLGFAGAFSKNLIDSTTSSKISNSTVKVNMTSLSSTNTNTIKAIAASGSASRRLWTKYCRFSSME